MNRNPSSHRRREIITLAALTALCGASIFFYFLLIGGTLLLAFLGMMTVLFLVALFNYLVWGKELADEGGRRDYEEEMTPEEGPWMRRRYNDLPPVLRERIRGSLFNPRDASPKEGDWWNESPKKRDWWE